MGIAYKYSLVDSINFCRLTWHIYLQDGLIEMESRFFADDASTVFWVFGFMLIQAAGIIASLYFRWSVRNPETA